ncbi:hypothetical protein [Inquilinus sp. Marseille-Q2685]|uniref:hypothetical protein n=1 Tax=Inquilinus sp. Marseille-Q2685 TaxID=2866581 RepID=UPI001CE424D6|nr:hypothetical protein [Inquilinus sp. Marseille-Q2685]
MIARRFDPLPLGLALLALGLGVAIVTFASMTADDVSYARTRWTALLAMGLAAPAIVLGMLGQAPGPWWRSFWTAGLLAYLLHFWWAVFRSYHGDFAAIAERQGWNAYTNYLATALWTLDVALAWLPLRPGWGVTAVRVLNWLLITASFIVASAIFRSWPDSIPGWALGALVVLTGAARICGFFRTAAVRAPAGQSPRSAG